MNTQEAKAEDEAKRKQKQKANSEASWRKKGLA